MKQAFAALAAALAVAAPAAAQEVRAGDLTLSRLQLRAVPNGVPNTAAYLVIANAGDRPDKLVGAACACAARVEVHLSQVANGRAMMAPAGDVEIPAHGELALKPGGYHLMIMGLKTPLKDGSTQELQLKFQRAGTVTAAFPVRARIEP